MDARKLSALLLALPLLIVIAIPSASTGAIVWLYGVAFLADLAAAVILAVLAFRYRARALRGDLFSIPLVTPLADRMLRIDR